jgi:hypothetical protein
MADNINFSNFAKSTLSTNITSVDSEIQITESTSFPDGSFTAVIWSQSSPSPADDPLSEVVVLTKTAEGLYSAVRGSEGTAARDWNEGSSIANVVTAETMNSICKSTSAYLSVHEVTENSYEMTDTDTKLFFSFAQAEAYKTVTLPQVSTSEGKIFTLINRSAEIDQKVRIYPSIGDAISEISTSYITLTSGASLTIIPENGSWKILEYSPLRYSAINVVSTDKTVSTGEGIIYADCTAGEIYLTLASDDGVFKVPLVIVKTDSTENPVSVEGLDNQNGYTTLAVQNESVTVITDMDGSKKVINRYIPSQTSVNVSGTTGYQLSGRQNTVLVQTGADDTSVFLHDPSEGGNETVTVKKTDAGTGVVNIYGKNFEPVEGNMYDSITSEGEYKSYAFDGSSWTRIG